MAENPHKSLKWKHTGAVAVGEALGWLAGAVANFLSETLLHAPKRALDMFIGKHLIEPHLDFFVKHFKAFTPQLRRQDHGAGMSTSAQAAYIAGGMTNVLASNTAGALVSLGVQRVLEGKDMTRKEVKRLSIGGDVSLHLLTMLSQPTVFAEQSENMTRRISGVLQKKLGLNPNYARNLAFSTVYYGGPEFAGSVGRFVGHLYGERKYPPLPGNPAQTR
jgi:hypothetical protein